MKRLLMVMVLAVVAGGQDPGLTNGEPNGLWWRQLDTSKKTNVVLGAEAGFHEAQMDILMGNPVCSGSLVDTYRHKAVAHPRGDLIREIDAFYNDGANISLPWEVAFVYSNMKLGGATKDELDAVRNVLK